MIALRILKAAGVDPDRDLRRQGLGASESADALKDGKIDAFFWSGGLPSPAVQDLSHTPGITLALVPSGDLVPALQREHGPSLFPARDPAVRVSRRRTGRARRRRRQRAGRQPLDGRAAGLRHHARAVREAGRRSPRFTPKRASCRCGRRSPVRPPGSIRARCGSTKRRDIERETILIDAAPVRQLRGFAGRLSAALCAGLSLYALYWVLFIVQPQIYRVSFLLIALVLTSCSFRSGAGTCAASRGRTGRSSRRRSRRCRGRSPTSTRSSTARPIRRRSTWSSARRHPARARGDAPRGRLDPAGDGRRVPRVRVRRTAVRSDRPVRCWRTAATAPAG